MMNTQCSKHVKEYNKLIIKQEFLHSVGQLLRLYWYARSEKHQNSDLIFERNGGHEHLKIVYPNWNSLRSSLWRVTLDIQLNFKQFKCCRPAVWIRAAMAERAGAVWTRSTVPADPATRVRRVKVRGLERNKYIWMWMCVLSSQLERSIELRGAWQPKVRNTILLLGQ